MAAFWGITHEVGAFSARLTHETANADLSRRMHGDTASLSDEGEYWRYYGFFRRDEFPEDRTLVNAVALAMGGWASGFTDHRFYLGLGTHYQKSETGAREGPAGAFYPAAGLCWHGPVVLLELAGAEKFARAQLAVLTRLAIPLEFAGFFEFVESEPRRWSLDILAYLTRYAGVIAGYEPITGAARAGFWLRPLENLTLRSLSRIPFVGESRFEFSLAYAWSESIGKSGATVIDKEPVTTQPQTRPARKVPEFATLVKWGLTPVAALKLARDKNICALDERSRAVMARHHWECHDTK